jgi:hypothetical protein
MLFPVRIFIEMRRIDIPDIAYLFVLYLQPINPNIKYCPICVIESPSGIGNDRIPAQIDEILALIQSLIRHRFIASDGDSSYDQRHKTFIDFWEPIYQGFGLDRTLAELRQYLHVMPLSDLLHLGKNFRTRFLKYELTFVYGRASGSISQERVRAILDLAAPLSDLSQIGKMRDAYPFVITRIENIFELIDQNAFPEAVALLPLSLCFHMMRLETITREMQIDLLRTGFFLVWKLYELRIRGIDKNPEKTSTGGKRTIFTFDRVLRFLNTVLLFLFLLNNYTHLALDRLSTHPLEKSLGS